MNAYQKVSVIGAAMIATLTTVPQAQALSPAAKAGMAALAAVGADKIAATVNSETKIEHSTVKNSEGGTVRAIQNGATNGSVNEAGVLRIDQGGLSYGKSIELRGVDVINTGTLSATQERGDGAVNGAYVLTIGSSAGLDISNSTTISNSQFANHGVIEANQSGASGSMNRAAVGILGGRR